MRMSDFLYWEFPLGERKRRLGKLNKAFKSKYEEEGNTATSQKKGDLLG